MAETNRYEQSGPRREPKQSGERERPRTGKRRKRRRRPLILTILIRIFQIIGTLFFIGVITGTFMICYAAVYVKTVVMPRTYLNLDEYTLNENSVIYYRDKNTDQWVELQTLVGSENRELVEYTDIPEDLINAFIAIEDKRFWIHQGVDWKRTAAGLLRMFTGQSIQGGSTIDQQLIKNLTTYNDVTVTRKIQEIFTALELDSNYSKEMILTVYLNRIYMGNNCYGVQAASQYYFGKNVWDLNLAECASLAGITNNPSLYAPYGDVEVVRYRCQNPDCKVYSSERKTECSSCGAVNSFDNGTVWTNREWNKDRQEIILREMAKEDEARDNKAYITAAERDAAIAAPLVFSRDRTQNEEEQENIQKRSSTVKYSWYVEAVIDNAIEALMEARGISRDAATQLVFNGGLSIYTPYDPSVQYAVDTVFNDRSNLDQVSSRTGQRLMASITVVDNSSGYVVAIGNTMDKTVDRGLNPAVHTVRQPGSSIKPLSVYAPALEMGLITPVTVIDDNPFLLNEKPWPINVNPVWGGLTTVMDGVTRSLNTVAVRTLDMVTPKASYDFMVEKFGITTLEPGRFLPNGNYVSDIDRSPLALGGLTYGLSTYEAAAAFATFPRNGAFTPATTIQEIRDASGRTVIDNSRTTKFVLKASTAYYINSMLTNAVAAYNGTGTAARISGQTVAGKTGTTNNRYNLWFSGYTQYYTASVWTGFPSDEKISSQTNPSAILWRKVMEIVHDGLEDRSFDVPGELTTYQICLDCGKLAVANCHNDVREDRTRSFLLLSGDGPTERCTCHVPVQICTESPIMNYYGNPSGYYHLAGEFCPEESIKTVTLVDYQRELANASVWVGDQWVLLSSYQGTEFSTCDVHTAAQPPDEGDDPIESDDPNESDPPPVVTPPYVTPSTTPPSSGLDQPPDDPYVPAGGRH